MAKVAFIGLGVMGFPMAGHLKEKGGHDVTVYNRTAAKAEEWARKHGGRSAATPAEAARDADFVFTCVGNDDDLRSVTLGETGAIAGMKTGAILVDNVLWGGSVIDPSRTDEDTEAIRRLNGKVGRDPRVASAMIAVGDGLTVAVRVPAA